MKNSEITRALKVFLKILTEPTTKRALSEEFGCHPDTIVNIFKHIKDAGMEVVCSDYPEYTYMVKYPRLKGGRKPLPPEEREKRRAESLKRYREKNLEKIRQQSREKNRRWRQNNSSTLRSEDYLSKRREAAKQSYHKNKKT